MMVDKIDMENSIDVANQAQLSLARESKCHLSRRYPILHMLELLLYAMKIGQDVGSVIRRSKLDT